ncbi:MAG: XRE family transcriptional regulator [Bacillota bacterium]|nr:XRE family transcriptional regulator [Bacillota bacterium]
MTLAKNIRYLRLKNNWSQDYLADSLGYKSYTTIQKWETGVSEPPLKTLGKLAELFGVDMDELANRDFELPSENNNTSKSTGVSIPIVSTIVAGMPADAYEDILGYEEISHSLAKTGDFICLKVKGDSMSPVIQDSDLVIVRHQPDVENGDIAVVRINGDEATLKQVQKSEAGITLIAYNPSVYPPHFYSNKEIEELPVVVEGKVVEMKRSF